MKSSTGRLLLTISTLITLVAPVLLTAGCARNSSEGKYTETLTLAEFQESPDAAPVYDEIDSVGSPTADSATDSLAATDIASEPEPEKRDSTDAGASPASRIDPAAPRHKRIANNQIGNLKEVFNDSNHFQLQHARRLGINPVSDIRSLYRTRRPLVKIDTNDDFLVDELTHSFPFLVPEAAQLLHDIGRDFRRTVAERNGGDYRIIVTSVLRTPATVKKLRRVNRNATEQSTHQYATTFDITYNRFDCVSGKDDTNFVDLKATLAEVIHRLHAEGRCMVKYEIKSPCFHITVVR